MVKGEDFYLDYSRLLFTDLPAEASSQFGPVPIQPHKVNSAHKVNSSYFLVSSAQVNSAHFLAHFLVNLAIWKASEKIEEACAKNCPPSLLVQVQTKEGAANGNTGERACLFAMFPAYL